MDTKQYYCIYCHKTVESAENLEGASHADCPSYPEDGGLLTAKTFWSRGISTHGAKVIVTRFGHKDVKINAYAPTPASRQRIIDLLYKTLRRDPLQIRFYTNLSFGIGDYSEEP